MTFLEKAHGTRQGEEFRLQHIIIAGPELGRTRDTVEQVSHGLERSEQRIVTGFSAAAAQLDEVPGKRKQLPDLLRAVERPRSPWGWVVPPLDKTPRGLTDCIERVAIVGFTGTLR